MRNREDIINFEVMGGWPIYKMNLKEIIEHIGGKLNEETGMWEIPNSDKLNVYPRRLRDDGMGYGVDQEWITDFHLFTDPNDESQVFCNVFTEKEIDYPYIWDKAGVYPGLEIEFPEGFYSIDSVDKTDNGFVFTCNEHNAENWKEILDTKLVTYDEIINMQNV